jgi:hypothetical protein
VPLVQKATKSVGDANNNLKKLTGKPEIKVYTVHGEIWLSYTMSKANVLISYVHST